MKFLQTAFSFKIENISLSKVLSKTSSSSFVIFTFCVYKELSQKYEENTNKNSISWIESKMLHFIFRLIVQSLICFSNILLKSPLCRFNVWPFDSYHQRSSFQPVKENFFLMFWNIWLTIYTALSNHDLTASMTPTGKSFIHLKIHNFWSQHFLCLLQPIFDKGSEDTILGPISTDT